ncbi:FAD binding domain-containing protein [Aspergillus pseudodeflectus]|uniref:FAD binding domain-containing protein n=1 Tax=Aspergillus pseudodeflectus TaxID=176178 RepID=A0ABR4KSK0_9EURO
MAPIATIEVNGASNRIGALHEQTRRASTGQVPGEVDTEFFIVGAGPAGASLACFLANYGLKGVMISAAPATANTPRAHITNMAALECLRDIGLDKELHELSSKGDCMIHTRWCHSMAGEEYARIHSWGHAPERKATSPCSPVDLPQTLLEPVLVRHAAQRGFATRFNTELLSFENGQDGVITATVYDKLSSLEYKIRTKYLFGADGARSQVVKQLGLPLSIKPSQGLAINVLVKADLSHLVDTRRGNLHWVMQPDKEHPQFGWQGIVRMVKPWNEWMFILLPTRDCDISIEPSKDEYLQRVREFIGDETPAEILDISKWFINEIVAEKYSEGNIFCLGDAVHRHPPMNGLGSNTCIQDAFNLAWKVAYVHKGLAPPSLLDTYSIERQPVGNSIITRANQAFRDHFDIWEALGTLPNELQARQDALSELREPSPKGRARRAAFQKAITQSSREFHGLGIEMGQVYSGPGIYASEEGLPYKRIGRAAEDEVLYYEPSTYPGCRLPHVWLNKTVPTEPVSIIDLAGHGAFTLFTGIGGDPWRRAAEEVSAELGIQINVHAIGFRQEWEDSYFDWERLRGVEEDGAVLVRPDRVVGWRAQSVPRSSESPCAMRLLKAMTAILGR